MSNKIYYAIALTGGGTGALDAIDGDLLNDLDSAKVVTADNTYTYTLDDDSGESESSPDIISPDSNAGDKRWILTSLGGIGWKAFSGTTDSDSQTTFAHGLTNANILGAITSIQQSTNDVWIGGVIADLTTNQQVADSYRWYIVGSNFILDDVGANLRGRPYRVLIFYVT